MQESGQDGTAGIRFGLMRGELEIAADFDAPLSADLLAEYSALIEVV